MRVPDVTVLMDLEDAFKDAVKYVNGCKQSLDSRTTLQLYGLYRQSTIGDCNRPRPFFLNFRGRRKWDTWNTHRGLDKDSAKAKYISTVSELQAKEERQAP